MKKPHEPVDPDTLTREQRAIWDAFMAPTNESITRAFADAQFRYICWLDGVPFEPSHRG